MELILNFILMMDEKNKEKLTNYELYALAYFLVKKST